MRRLLIVGFLLPLAAPIADAQESRRVGVAMGYPESVAVVWHVADALAIRPELSFRSGHSDSFSDGFSTATSDSTFVGVGASALLYVKTWDALRAYISPRVTFSRSKTTTETTVTFPPLSFATLSAADLASLTAIGFGPVSPLTTTSTITGHTISASGSFGAQYAIHERFSAYGEIGLEFSRATGSSERFGTIAFTPPRTTNWATRSAVGVIVYF